MKTKYISIILIVSIISSCAGYRPIVDIGNINPNQYEQDLKECQQYAERINPVEGAITGAVVGAAVGALLVAVLSAAMGVHDSGGYVAAGAIVGGTQVAAGVATKSALMQRNIIRNCMKTRGYDVLDWE